MLQRQQDNKAQNATLLVCKSLAMNDNIKPKIYKHVIIVKACIAQ